MPRDEVGGSGYDLLRCGGYQRAPRLVVLLFYVVYGCV